MQFWYCVSQPNPYQEVTLRSSMIAILLLVLSPVLFAQQNVPEIPYDSVPNFFKLPADLYLGEVPGVAVNSKGPSENELYVGEILNWRVQKLILHPDKQQNKTSSLNR